MASNYKHTQRRIGRPWRSQTRRFSGR